MKRKTEWCDVFLQEIEESAYDPDWPEEIFFHCKVKFMVTDQVIRAFLIAARGIEFRFSKSRILVPMKFRTDLCALITNDIAAIENIDTLILAQIKELWACNSLEYTSVNANLDLWVANLRYLGFIQPELIVLKDSKSTLSTDYPHVLTHITAWSWKKFLRLFIWNREVFKSMLPKHLECAEKLLTNLLILEQCR